jgi:tetratricopeptide (TPR) repeat protein
VVLAYSRLAEVYLHQGTKPKEARKLTEQALQNHEASLLLRFYGKEALIETLAIHAWVLAELGLHDDAAEAVERAFAVAPRNNKPLLAALHLRAGYVSLRRGNRHQAKQHFTTGQELDPKGHYGRLAGSALAQK